MLKRASLNCSHPYRKYDNDRIIIGLSSVIEIILESDDNIFITNILKKRISNEKS